jgi:hypothetical protein
MTKMVSTVPINNIFIRGQGLSCSGSRSCFVCAPPLLHIHSHTSSHKCSSAMPLHHRHQACLVHILSCRGPVIGCEACWVMVQVVDHGCRSLCCSAAIW